MGNYINKQVYIGIDVHKKTYACASVCDGDIVKKDTIIFFNKMILMSGLIQTRNFGARESHIICVNSY